MRVDRYTVCFKGERVRDQLIRQRSDQSLRNALGYTPEPAYSKLKGSKESCLQEKFTITGIEK